MSLHCPKCESVVFNLRNGECLNCRIATLEAERDEALRKVADAEEAEHLIALIAMEFKSDLMSVQCFDVRVVDRVNALDDKFRAAREASGE